MAFIVIPGAVMTHHSWQLLIPSKHLTLFPNQIFENWLRKLTERNSIALYARLHDRAYHRSPPVIEGTTNTFARWMSLHTASVEPCIDELLAMKLIRRLHVSRKQHQQWAVPLANLEPEAGNWFPVPRFIVRKYVPAYQDAVVLLLLLEHHNYKQQKYVYPGIERLGYLLGWPEKRVQDAIDTMSTGALWRTLKTDLPKPLTVKKGQHDHRWLTHYRVKVFRYHQTLRAKTFSPIFAKRFNL